MDAPDNRTEVVGDRWEVQRNRMNDIITEHLSEWREWSRYRQYGFRYSGGWADQPATYIDIIDIYEDEYTRYMNSKQGKN